MIVTVVFAYVHAYRNRGEGYIPPIDSDRAASGERQKLVKWAVHSSHKHWSSELYTLPTKTGQVNCTLFPQKLVKWTVHSSHRNWSNELYTLPTETGQVNCTLPTGTDQLDWTLYRQKLVSQINRTRYRQKLTYEQNILPRETCRLDWILYWQKLVQSTEHSTDRKLTHCSTERNWSNELNALLKETGQLAHSTNRNPFNRAEHPVNTQKLALWTATLPRKTGRLS